MRIRKSASETDLQSAQLGRENNSEQCYMGGLRKGAEKQGIVINRRYKFALGKIVRAVLLVLVTLYLSFGLSFGGLCVRPRRRLDE